MNNIIIEITKEIAEKVQAYNLSLKKKLAPTKGYGKNPLKNFFWPCFDKMLPQVQEIHVKRTSLLLYSGNHQPAAHIQHDFFVQERLKAGWVLADDRVDYIWENDCMKWIGHDPYLQDLRLCPAWFQEWCIARNKINYKIIGKYI